MKAHLTPRVTLVSTHHSSVYTGGTEGAMRGTEGKTHKWYQSWNLSLEFLNLGLVFAIMHNLGNIEF